MEAGERDRRDRVATSRTRMIGYRRSMALAVFAALAIFFLSGKAGAERPVPTCPVSFGASEAAVLEQFPDLKQQRTQDPARSVWGNDAATRVHFMNGRAVGFERAASTLETSRILRGILGQPDYIDVQLAPRTPIATYTWRCSNGSWFTVTSIRVETLESVSLSWNANDGYEPRGQRVLLGLPRGIGWDMDIDARPGTKNYDPDSDSWWKDDGTALLFLDRNGELAKVVAFGDVSESEQQVNNTIGQWKLETNATAVGDGMLVWRNESTSCVVDKLKIEQTGLSFMRLTFLRP